MGFFKRVWNWVRGNANSAMDSIEDPEKMLEQAIRDMREQHHTAKQQVAVALAQEKRLGHALVEKQEAVDGWDRKAMKALQAGKEDLARTALERKGAAQSELTEFQTQHKKAKDGCERIKKALVDLDTKITDADRKKRILIARKKRADAQKTINDTLQSLSTNDAGTVFGHMEDRIQQLEAEADASNDMAALGPGHVEDDLNKQFLALDSGDVDKELAEMKAMLALGPASDEEDVA